MRLTIEQRMRNIEREAVVLHDTIELLHKLLKEQQRLINDYIAKKFSHSSSGGSDGNGQDEDGMYIFVCQKKFNRLEENIKRISRQIDDNCLGRKVG